ncbi:hypothetical protein KCP73_20960 [Salmonella enterica subsp. enterica]|nr:hypothetical protein KCP73_20960 [Salmonella enterica subsp. enterica]
MFSRDFDDVYFLMTKWTRRTRYVFLAAVVLRAISRTFTSIIYSRGKRFWHRTQLPDAVAGV